MTRYYLGIDGGQSSTTALVADEAGRILGVGRGGPCNHVTGSEARSKFRRVIGSALEQACREADLDLSTHRFAAACLGFSGGAEDKLELSREIVPTGQLKVTHDAEIALSGALAGGPGIIVVAGTGSIAFGRNAQGLHARAGGWGYIFGDEGGAFHLARLALRAALRWEEGWGPSTSLHAGFLGQTGASSANSLLHRVYSGYPREDFASLARLVTALAEEGDVEAVRIVEEAAGALASYAQGAHRKLFPQGEPVPVARVGGVFRSSLFERRFALLIHKEIGSRVEAPLFNPAAGAIIEALRLDNNPSQLTGVPETIK